MSSSNKIHTAVREDDLKNVLALLNQGCDVNQCDENLFTPLHIAAQEGFLDIAKLLLERGATINARARHGEEPLLMAITHRWGAKADPDVIRLLISHGANLSALDNDGWTPLFAAAARGATKVVEILVASGAEVDQPTSFGYTPPHRAVRIPHVETVIFLLNNGSDIDLPNSDGQSAAQIIASESQGPSYGGEWFRSEIRAQMRDLVQRYSKKYSNE